MRVLFRGVGCGLPTEEIAAKVAYARGLGLPGLGAAEARGPLAVVAGGPSIVEHVEEIKRYPTVWAVNGAWRWCRERGIEATLFTIDPMPGVGELAQGVERAVVADTCDRALYDALRGADVRMFTLEETPHGPTSVSAVPVVAATMGYAPVVLYGCESCYAGEELQHHAYPASDDGARLLMRVQVGERFFWTKPELVMQADFLAPVIRGARGAVQERSGGLLRALVAGGEWDMVECSRALYETLEPCLSGGDDGTGEEAGRGCAA